MYSRLRRLITTNNDFVLDQICYELEVELQDTEEPVLEGPTATTYIGYDCYAGRLFYYGCQNESEFDKLCARLQEIENQTAKDSNRDNVSSDEDPQLLPQLIEPPQLDLYIDIEMNCPIELAPIEYSEKSQLKNIESLCNRDIDPNDPALLQGSQSSFFFKMVMHCPALSEIELPSSVEFEIKSSDSGNANTVYSYLLKNE
jgi:hypothetical protein